MIDTDGMELRIAKYINYKTGGKKKAFAEKLGWSNQYLNKILNGESIGLNPVLSLLKTFPELNARWLLFGEGAMIEGFDQIIKKQLLSLLKIEKFLPVMTPQEISQVVNGKYEWDSEQIQKWATLTAEREAQINKRFADSYAKQ